MAAGWHVFLQWRLLQPITSPKFNGGNAEALLSFTTTVEVYLLLLNRPTALVAEVGGKAPGLVLLQQTMWRERLCGKSISPSGKNRCRQVTCIVWCYLFFPFSFGRFVCS